MTKVTRMAELPLEVQSLIDIQENPFVLIGPDYRILAANQAYCEAYGVSRRSIVGMRCYEVSHHSPVPCHLNGEHCPHQQVIASGQTQQVLHTHYDRSNRAEHVRIKGYPIRTGDGGLCVGELISRIAHSADIDCEEIRMVGRSPAFLACVDNLTRVAESEASILLYGESGVGKELAAQYIHKRSARKDRPYLAVNCASIPEGLFETELFGHEKGAFTGADRIKVGKLEHAGSGTVFLDEIGDMPMDLQAKLLRVLQEEEFVRVGGLEPIPLKARIVAATHSDLPALVREGRFREDLFYRLSVSTLQIPPLRERRSDIPLLAAALLDKIAAKLQCPRPGLDSEAMRRLLAHDWPGNVRELENVLTRAVALTVDTVLTAADLQMAGPAAGHARPHSQAGPSLTLAAAEKLHVEKCLLELRWNISRAARQLDISPTTLRKKITDYGLTNPFD